MAAPPSNHPSDINSASLPYLRLLPEQAVPGISDLMAMIIVVILVAGQDAIMGSADPMAALIVMDGAKESLSTVANLMAVLIIVIGISPQ